MCGFQIKKCEMLYQGYNSRECVESQESCNLVDGIMATSNNSIHSQLPKFIGKNFNNWCIQMRVLFGSQDLWDLMNIGYNEITNSKEFEALSKE